MNTQQRTIAAMAAAVVVACGGAALANASGAHGTGTIVLAADSDHTYQGAGGNGAAKLKNGPNDSDVGGDGAAQVDNGKNHGGVGGEARGNAFKKPLNQ